MCQTAYPWPVRTGAVIALLVVVTTAAGLAFWAGGRAGGVTAAARPVPDVVGLRLPEARRALGNARLTVVRVPWAANGIVARVIGLQFDGRYLAGTRLTLDVGR